VTKQVATSSRTSQSRNASPSGRKLPRSSSVPKAAQRKLSRIDKINLMKTKISSLEKRLKAIKNQQYDKFPDHTPKMLADVEDLNERIRRYNSLVTRLENEPSLEKRLAETKAERENTKIKLTKTKGELAEAEGELAEAMKKLDIGKKNYVQLKRMVKNMIGFLQDDDEEVKERGNDVMLNKQNVKILLKGVK
jgi:hypothetical protein